MNELLPINLIYQCNAKFNAFVYTITSFPNEISKQLNKVVILLAIAMSSTYESCQALAYMKKLSKKQL